LGPVLVDVLDLLRELDLETYNQYITGKKFMQLGGHKISSYISAIPALIFFTYLPESQSGKWVSVKTGYSKEYAFC
jgi:hypothetical protein